MDDMDEILKGDAPADSRRDREPEPQPAADVPMGEPEGAAAAAVEGESPDAPAAAQPEGEGAPPAPGNVPLAALTAERRERQDWKERAIREEEQRKGLERELQELRAKLSAPPPQQQAPQQPPAPREMPDPVSDPVGFREWTEERMLNERMNMSEAMVRAQHDDVDEAVEVFKAEAQRNPALVAQLRAQQHPWQWAYQQAKRIKAMSEIGDDPAAFRARIEAEARQRFEAEMAQQPAPRGPAVNLPPSLSTARSAAARGAPVVSGPYDMKDLLGR